MYTSLPFSEPVKNIAKFLFYNFESESNAKASSNERLFVVAPLLNMSLNLLCAVLVACFCFGETLGANILYVAPIASPSLQRWNTALAMGLRNRGHNITMLSHDHEKEPIPENFTLILLEGIYEKLNAQVQSNEVQEKPATKAMKALFKHVEFCCTHDFNTTGLKTLMDYPSDYAFDLIVFDSSYGRYFYPLVQRFNDPPAIAVTPYRLPPILSNSFGSHLHTSYVPYYNTEFSTQMTFFERLANFFYTYVEVMYRKNSFSPLENKLVKKQFGEEIPALRDFERNISILLTNLDFNFDFPMALPPNIIPVGGLHLTPGKQLPEDLRDIVENAKHGVIYFSLGSILRSDKLNDKQKNALVGAFAQIPQLVLWKYEGEDVPANISDNVVIRRSFPQNDILGHRNTKLFITHGGILSTQEAMYHAVPIVGIPFTPDQRANVRRMERRNISILLNHKTLTQDVVLKAIREVLKDQTYIKNIRRIARRFRDQPQSPMQRAIYWIEYVLRHGSAEHLVSPARDMDAYQTGNLDVLALALGSIIGIYLAYLFLPGVIQSVRESLFSSKKAGKK